MRPQHIYSIKQKIVENIQTSALTAISPLTSPLGQRVGQRFWVRTSMSEVYQFSSLHTPTMNEAAAVFEHAAQIFPYTIF